MNVRLLNVVIHDVAPATWARCERVMTAVREVADVPLTLLAVPDYHHLGGGLQFERALQARRQRGDEIALHGYSHLDEKPCSGLRERALRQFYTRGEGEFSALTEAEARYRIEAGKDWFRRNHWPLHGFVAPAWLLSPDAWHVVRNSGFAYTSTLREIILLPTDDTGRPSALKTQPIVYSTGSWWRRKLSLPWNAALAHRLTSDSGPAIARVELHPWDADHDDTRASFQQALWTLLREREACTTHDALRIWQRSRQLLDEERWQVRPSSVSGHPSLPR